MPHESDCQADERAVFFRSDSHFRKCRWAAPGDFQFSVALQHHANRFAAGLLGYLCRISAPAVDAKLAAKASANVVLMHVNVRLRNLQGLRVLAGETGNILRRDVGEEMIAVCPLRDGAVAFQAAVRDYRAAVGPFGDDFRCL